MDRFLENLCKVLCIVVSIKLTTLTKRQYPPNKHLKVISNTASKPLFFVVFLKPTKHYKKHEKNITKIMKALYSFEKTN
ncbi:hypothetical protein AT246_04225 [Bartonella henselae]|nr:hypothetical protein BhenCHDE101_06525 [Bartonella henselae]PNM38855.1 hypothetical protein AL470_005780 [Bartonella henselae str. Houston-1]OLL38371.1 hypothetical protein AT244_01775 [Bartonella henselae]OLL42347.1 hypothetical protein AT237_04195 [Bartonella henselae]OLL46869.1 hypothetical protein AT245_05685 [Bartonella henselae]